MPLNHVWDPVKQALDGASVVAAIGAFMSWVPPLAALASLIWTLLRVYEYVKNKRLKDEKHCACCGTNLEVEYESRYRDSVPPSPEHHRDAPGRQVRPGCRNR